MKPDKIKLELTVEEIETLKEALNTLIVLDTYYQDDEELAQLESLVDTIDKQIEPYHEQE